MELNNIKKFDKFINELYKDTYINAASKALRYGHRDRSKKLYKYGLEKGEFRDIDRISSFTFDFNKMLTSRHIVGIEKINDIYPNFYIVNYEVFHSNEEYVIIKIILKSFYNTETSLKLKIYKNGRSNLSMSDNDISIFFSSREEALRFKTSIKEDLIDELIVNDQIDKLYITTMKESETNSDYYKISDVCSECSNSGLNYCDCEFIVCPTCDGNGGDGGEYINFDRNYYQAYRSKRCDHCNGEGQIIDPHCSICGGKGTVKCDVHRYKYVYIGGIKRLNVNELYKSEEKILPKEATKPSIKWNQNISHNF